MAIDTMKAGAYAAVEPGAASTLKEGWELVTTAEATGISRPEAAGGDYRTLQNMKRNGDEATVII